MGLVFALKWRCGLGARTIERDLVVGGFLCFRTAFSSATARATFKVEDENRIYLYGCSLIVVNAIA